jgi:hypothetical protein
LARPSSQNSKARSSLSTRRRPAISLALRVPPSKMKLRRSSQGPWGETHADPAGDYAEGRLQFGAVTVDWTLSTRETDLPLGTLAGAARYIAVDGDMICDFSDYSRLHSIVYQEIIAGRGHRIEDAAGAVKLAERVCQMAETELPAAH